MKRTAAMIFFLAWFLCAGAWNRVNHQAIGYIAEQHLTPKAYNTLKTYLHGECISYYAANVDDYRNTEYKGVPHTFHVNGKLVPQAEEGVDATYHILRSIEALKDHRNLDDSVRLYHIKLLVHLVGDIHCPSHTCYDDGRDHKHGRYKIYDYKGVENKKFHSYIDGVLTSQKFPGGFLEMAYFADPLLRPRATKADKDYMKEVQQGEVIDWAADIIERTHGIYDTIQPGHHFTTEEQMETARVCKDQILRAGYRLAEVLNMIFG